MAGPARVLLVMVALLAAPAFVACGARSELGNGPLDGGEDTTTDRDVRTDGDARADADARTDADADADARTDADADADARTDADADARSDADADAGAADATLFLTAIAVTQDHVQPGDQGLTPDGQPDGEFTAIANGAFDAFILVTTNLVGDPSFGQQWDTLVGQDPIPPGFSFTIGGQTWILGVWENAVRLNDVNGRVSIPAGPHTLTLYAANSGYFNQGRRFRLYGRSNATWISSNIAVWP